MTLAIPTEPTFPPPSDCLTPDQVARYLTRIRLPPTLYPSKDGPSLELLSEIYLAQHYNVPKDTTSMHVPEADWYGESKPIVLSSSLTQMPVGLEAFEQIVDRSRGAYCWGANTTFARLLRSFGYRVSEVPTKVWKPWANEDPNVKECLSKWGTITHIVLIVDWEGSDGRYVVDVGFGGGSCPRPIPLKSGAQVSGLNDSDSWKLEHEEMPVPRHLAQPIDTIPGWTVYHRDPKSPPDSSPWVPAFHFILQSLSYRDIGLYHHYSQSHNLAAFTKFFLVTRLVPGTGGARRSLMYSEEIDRKNGNKGLAKVHTTGGSKGGSDGGGSFVGGGGRDVDWVPMQTGPMRKYLEENFDFIFPGPPK